MRGCFIYSLRKGNLNKNLKLKEATVEDRERAIDNAVAMCLRSASSAAPDSLRTVVQAFAQLSKFRQVWTASKREGPSLRPSYLAKADNAA